MKAVPMRLPAFLVSALLLLPGAAFAAPALTVVAAENMYGGLAEVVAGSHAQVVSILSNPDQDPHLFEADPKTARALASARIVIGNGADYDPWVDKLLAASPRPDRVVITVADLAGKTSGDNPHLWYDPATMTRLADRLATDLGRADPAHAAEYRANAARFTDGLRPLDVKIATMRGRYAGRPVTASEPVFGYMAGLVGLTMRNDRFQTAVMNGTEPSPADVAAFEDDLRSHKVDAMITNTQADDAAVRRLVGIARDAHVPVVGVTETEPAGKGYAAWMVQQLDALDTALAGARS